MRLTNHYGWLDALLPYAWPQYGLIPGTDHAGIATQIVVERRSMHRKFLAMIWVVKSS